MFGRAERTMEAAGDIGHYGKSVAVLFKEGVFPGQMYTLAEHAKNYHDISTGIRESVLDDYGKGEWLATVVETDGARELGKGFLELPIVHKPEDILSSLKTGAYAVKGGTRIAYRCPPKGYRVPGDGKLWHPEVGAAIATVQSREEAVGQVAKYIEKHSEEFAGFKIPRRFHDEFSKLFGERNFDPENPTPEQLAELETSRHWSPSVNSGVRAVRRVFWGRDLGPFCANLDNDIEDRYRDVGARPRSS